MTVASKLPPCREGFSRSSKWLIDLPSGPSIAYEVQRAEMFLALKKRYDCRENGQEDSRRCYRELANCY